MIEIDTLSRNKSIFNPDKELASQGNGIWDLTRSSVSFEFLNLKIQKYYLVDDDSQMRPDLVCLNAYGNLTNIGSLMKINGICNPFAIKTGVFFAIPVQERLDAAFSQKAKTISKGNTSNNPNSLFRKSQESKAFKVSDSRKKFLEAQQKAKNPVAQPLPPNVLQEGEVQTLRSTSFISLAPNASAGGPNPNALPV